MDRLRGLARRSGAFEIDRDSGCLREIAHPQPNTPPCTAEIVEGILSLVQAESPPHWQNDWQDAGVDHYPGDARGVVITTSPQPWCYAAQIPVSGTLDPKYWYWAKVNLQVRSGQIGVGILADGDVLGEELYHPASGPVVALLRLNHDGAQAILVRNGSSRGPSVGEIESVSVCRCLRPDG